MLIVLPPQRASTPAPQPRHLCPALLAMPSQGCEDSWARDRGQVCSPVPGPQLDKDGDLITTVGQAQPHLLKTGSCSSKYQMSSPDLKSSGIPSQSPHLTPGSAGTGPGDNPA